MPGQIFYTPPEKLFREQPVIKVNAGLLLPTRAAVKFEIILPAGKEKFPADAWSFLSICAFLLAAPRIFTNGTNRLETDIAFASRSADGKSGDSRISSIFYVQKIVDPGKVFLTGQLI